jgi:hypothetical protein
MISSSKRRCSASSSASTWRCIAFILFVHSVSPVSVAVELACAGAEGRSNRAERGVDVADIAEGQALLRLPFA